MSIKVVLSTLLLELEPSVLYNAVAVVCTFVIFPIASVDFLFKKPFELFPIEYEVCVTRDNVSVVFSPLVLDNPFSVDKISMVFVGPFFVEALFVSIANSDEVNVEIPVLLDIFLVCNMDEEIFSEIEWVDIAELGPSFLEKSVTIVGTSVTEVSFLVAFVWSILELLFEELVIFNVTAVILDDLEIVDCSLLVNFIEELFPNKVVVSPFNESILVDFDFVDELSEYWIVVLTDTNAEPVANEPIVIGPETGAGTGFGTGPETGLGVVFGLDTGVGNWLGVGVGLGEGASEL